MIAAHVARVQMRIRCGQPFEKLPELATLVQPPHLLGPTHVPPVNKNSGQGQPGFPTRDPTKLRKKTRVHGHVSLVQRDTEPTQDGTHRFAVLVRGSNHAQAREVDYHALLRTGNGGRRVRLGGACVIGCEWGERISEFGLS